jgi:hypothetical protein
MSEVQILSRFPAQQPDPESGVPKPVLAVTYSTAAVPPRTVTVPGDSPSEEEIAAAIRLDLESATKGPGETLTV